MVVVPCVVRGIGNRRFIVRKNIDKLVKNYLVIYSLFRKIIPMFGSITFWRDLPLPIIINSRNYLLICSFTHINRTTTSPIQSKSLLKYSTRKFSIVQVIWNGKLLIVSFWSYKDNKNKDQSKICSKVLVNSLTKKS